MMRQFFATTLGQILAIIATSSAITFHLFLLLLWLLPGVPPPPPWPWQSVYRIVNIVDSVKAVPENERPIIAAAAQHPGLSISLTQVPAPCATVTTDAHNLDAVLRSELGSTGPDVTVRSCTTGNPAQPIQVLVGLGDQTLEIRTGRTVPDPRRLTLLFVGALLFLCVAVAAMSAWAVWRVIRPLRRLSAKAEAFGQNISITPIDEEGPVEIRRAARAFNLMQERVTRSIRERTRLLAAISHDLRTPLTRMRLQLETRQTDDVRGKLLKDIGLMQSMITAALGFLRGGFEEEEKEWLDLGALLETLCDEYQEVGARVRYEGSEQIAFFCRPNAINRAVTNLVENGTHFGGEVVITAWSGDGVIAIEVADDGPGIPADRMKDVIEPFVRLDPSRSKHAGGAGLGLSIVKEIVEAHQGTLELAERQPHGLIARLRFPQRNTGAAGSPV